MARPPLEVADLIHAAGTAFFEHSRKWFTWLHLKVLTAIVCCRTSALGGHIDVFSVLHTWTQKLLHHPHVHCVVPAGGLSPDRTQWIAAPTGFFLPVQVLSRVFRGKFVAGLRELHASGRLEFHGGLVPLQSPPAFAAMLRSLFRSDWVVYSKRPFGGAEHVLRYLGCYTHRSAISNHRLVSCHK